MPFFLSLFVFLCGTFVTLFFLNLWALYVLDYLTIRSDKFVLTVNIILVPLVGQKMLYILKNVIFSLTREKAWVFKHALCVGLVEETEIGNQLLLFVLI
jgi:hypothetical protein